MAAITLKAQTTTLSNPVVFKAPHSATYFLRSATNSPVRSSPLDNSWIQARRSASSHWVELGSRIVLETYPETDRKALLTGSGLRIARDLSPTLCILQAPSGRAAVDIAQVLAKKAGVRTCHPIIRNAIRHQNPYAPFPSDPFFPNQWHLENRGTEGALLGPDLDVRSAWPRARGTGVVVAIADEGFQLDHPDLARNAEGAPHHDFFANSDNAGPFSAAASHATAVAGLVGALLNNHEGVSGVAPEAQLASWVIFGQTAGGAETITSTEQLMDMFQHALDRVSVQNHSWGNVDPPPMGIDALSEVGIAKAIAQGRDGKGVILVKAAGNGRHIRANANDDGFGGDPRFIAVAAARQDGRACSYSTPGACVLVAAPSGDPGEPLSDGAPNPHSPGSPNVLTTDRTGALGYSPGSGIAADYAGFNGTSASCPQIAGVVALMLSANPQLGYRDVQQILLHSARQFDPKSPDMQTNGAGFRFSHNLGYGIPNAGLAVELALAWSNRPPATRLALTNITNLQIPDDGLRVLCSAPGLDASLASVRCLPSLGLHADTPTATLPLVYVGQANSDIPLDLHGKAALIQRGTSLFIDKLDRAARAGAAFAIVYNNTGTTDIQSMGLTDYAMLPAVSIDKTSGDALNDYISNNPSSPVSAAIKLNALVSRFSVNASLLCEHVGVRIKTTHPSRQDVRITLVSPMGTRSILQELNNDDLAGPEDWTYWSVAHFYENAQGEWRVEISDENNTTDSEGAPAKGALTYVELIIDGLPIVDSDHDGLDDGWEMAYLKTLIYGPKDDPDGDGFSNAREQIMGTDPAQSNRPLSLEMSAWKPGYWRLSWPGRENATDSLYESRNQANEPWSALTSRSGTFPYGDVIIQSTNRESLYQMRRQ